MALPAIAAGPKVPSTMYNPLVQVMVIFMVLLALAIAILANVVSGVASMIREKLKEEKLAKTLTENKEKGNTGAYLTMLVVALFLSITSFAQDAVAEAVVDTTINGLSRSTFYAIISVIAIEILIMVVLIMQLKSLLRLNQKEKPAKVIVHDELKLSWWERINKSTSIAHEKEIDLDHEYDGIRELDNRIPPWWKLAFLSTIIFAFVYLWRYHVVKSAPLQIEELQIALQEGEDKKQAYLAKSAGNVDENTITMLDAAGIEAGKTLFSQNCPACHGAAGEGAAVGPNLSDEYWIHGGSLPDVFKSIKYGWPEKGMRSWKEDFSPLQMAQITSYIQSIQGSNPPNAKEPQGEKFNAGTIVADSASMNKSTP